jgi:manganese efflux pump family protein
MRVIGAVTLILSMAGLFIGTVAGALIGRRAEVLGGLVLIGIGAKILVEHVYFRGYRMPR